MSRTVSKSLATATVNVFDPSIEFELDENGYPVPNRSFELNGNPSDNRARIQAQKLYGKNVMVISVDVDETKLNVSPDVFIGNSKVCNPNESYGREYVTQTFKTTNVQGFYTDDNGMHVMNLTYNGTTTDNKLRNFACDHFGTLNVVITNTTVTDERRFMTREKYLKLATGDEIEPETETA